MGTQRNGFKRESHIISVDVGTTSIRCHIYDKNAAIKGSCSKKVTLMYPEPGWVEMDPEDLWKNFVAVVKGAVQDSGLQMGQMEALGISTQRSTFTTWDRKTGRPFHNFISWQDLRASELVESWNRSCTVKAVHGVMKMLYVFTRLKRFHAGSVVEFSTQHITMRLAWVLQHCAQVKQAVAEGNCCFGTVDTWLLYKLSKGSLHVTDYSNASTTGLFDPYQMCWSGFLFYLISLPLSIFPTVVDSGQNYGSSDPGIFGVPIRIMSVMADQQAAMFGECCFDPGDVKFTMGTGTFMNVNTGNKPHASWTGLYPLVGWKIGPELVYVAEGNSADTGNAMKWACDLDLCSDVRETEALAASVDDSNGVCFVPSFSGLQAPINDPRACASFMGLKPSTTKCHLVRAILESVAFRNKQLFDVLLQEMYKPITKIRVDGGVCTNDFIMQLTADLLGKKVSRCSHFDMSSLGAAYMAGLQVGFWKSREELKRLQGPDREFLPRDVRGEYGPVLQSWERAVQRSLQWYGKT